MYGKSSIMTKDPKPWRWGQTEGPLENGWYFWKSDVDAEDGKFLLAEIIDGSVYAEDRLVMPRDDYKGYWMGPISPNLCKRLFHAEETLAQISRCCEKYPDNSIILEQEINRISNFWNKWEKRHK